MKGQVHLYRAEIPRVGYPGDPPPIVVWVKSLVPEDAEGIRDITNLAEFRGISWIWYLLPVTLLAALAYWYWKKRQREEETEEMENGDSN